MIELNRIHVGDCLEIMRTMPDGCVRGVGTSPPYNLRNSSGQGMKARAKGRWINSKLAQGGYEGTDDNMPHEDYVRWQRNVLHECMRVTEEDGAIFYNHKWRVQHGLIQDRSDIVEGFPVRQNIIWQRSGGLNFNNGYFVPTYEVIYLIAKPGFKMTHEDIGVGDVWSFPPEKGNPHPAPFPVELPMRCAKALNGPVLDPFMGSGTTALACRKLGLDWIGIEKSQEYADMAEERMRQGELL